MPQKRKFYHKWDEFRHIIVLTTTIILSIVSAKIDLPLKFKKCKHEHYWNGESPSVAYSDK